MYHGDENEYFEKALENGYANVDVLEEFVAKYHGVKLQRSRRFARSMEPF